jgi:hypothetical protein
MPFKRIICADELHTHRTRIEALPKAKNSGRVDCRHTQPPGTHGNDFADPTLVHALRAIPEKGFRVLRVIYNETVDPMAVVTVYFDDETSDL